MSPRMHARVYMRCQINPIPSRSNMRRTRTVPSCITVQYQDTAAAIHWRNVTYMDVKNVPEKKKFKKRQKTLKNVEE